MWVVEYMVDTINGAKTILAEIQIRTLAMNFWATIRTFSQLQVPRGFPRGD